MRSTKIHTIPFTDIALTTRLAVELACKFSHLSVDINKHLPSLEKLLEKRTVDREKLELLSLAYHCCRNIASDYRYEVCRFTETISKHIHSIFNVDLNVEIKVILFKLMDLAIVAHSPNIADDRKLQEFVANDKVWSSHLRNFAYIAKLELKLAPKYKYRSANSTSDVNQVFAQFAARLFYLIEWKETVGQPGDENGESMSKRSKPMNKLQMLMGLAQPSDNLEEFNWKWLTVIGEIVYNYPAAFDNDDFQPLLQMLAHCQPAIEHESQIYAFAKCCYVLLQRDETFTATTNIIVANLCRDLWHKIADGAARVCTLNSKNFVESHILLQMLIHHQKYSSASFIEDVIKIFISKSTIKCDTTLQTLVTVMQRFNLDSLSNGKDLAGKILSYTLEKPNPTNLKKIITTAGSEKPSARVLAQVAVMCCLSKTDVVNYLKHSKLDAEKVFESNWKLNQQAEYKKEITDIIRQILLKCNERLLIEDEDFMKGFPSEFIKDEKRSEFPQEIKCIVDQEILEKLPNITEFNTKIINDDTDIDSIKNYLKLVMENNEIMMYLADHFLDFEAFNEEKFKSSFIVKKIEFHIQEIERLLNIIFMKRGALDLQDTHQLLVLIQSLFANKYHKKICLKIRNFELESCIRWVAKQVNHKFITNDNDDEDDKEMPFGWHEFVNAKMEEKIKFMAINILCEYNNVTGLNNDLIRDRFQQIEINCFDNMDLHTLFHILNVFGRQQSVDKETTLWAWSHIILICKNHHDHQYISSQLIKALRDIIYLSKSLHECTSSVVEVFSSFGTICARPGYSPVVVVEYIKQFKYFHQVRLNNFLRCNFL